MGRAAVRGGARLARALNERATADPSETSAEKRVSDSGRNSNTNSSNQAQRGAAGLGGIGAISLLGPNFPFVIGQILERTLNSESTDQGRPAIPHEPVGEEAIRQYEESLRESDAAAQNLQQGDVSVPPARSDMTAEEFMLSRNISETVDIQFNGVSQNARLRTFFSNVFGSLSSGLDAVIPSMEEAARLQGQITEETASVLNGFRNISRAFTAVSASMVALDAVNNLDDGEFSVADQGDLVAGLGGIALGGAAATAFAIGGIVGTGGSLLLVVAGAVFANTADQAFEAAETQLQERFVEPLVRMEQQAEDTILRNLFPGLPR